MASQPHDSPAVQLGDLASQLPPPIRRVVKKALTADKKPAASPAKKSSPKKAAKKPVAEAPAKAKKSTKIKRTAPIPTESSNIIELRPAANVIRREFVGTHLLYEGGIAEFAIKPGRTHLVTKSYAEDRPFLSIVRETGNGYVLVRIFGGDLGAITLTRPDQIKGKVRIVEERTTTGSRVIVEIMRAKGKVTDKLSFRDPLSKDKNPDATFAVRIPYTNAGLEVSSILPKQEEQKAAA